MIGALLGWLALVSAIAVGVASGILLAEDARSRRAARRLAAMRRELAAQLRLGEEAAKARPEPGPGDSGVIALFGRRPESFRG